jgi:hypothetical protein
VEESAMPRYVLHGGNESANLSGNEIFFGYMYKQAIAQDGILLCYFSKDESEWAGCLSRDMAAMCKVSGDKKPRYEIAEIDTFLEQVKRHKVIFIRGGNSEKLLKTMYGITTENDWLKEDKTYFGASAGALIMGKEFVARTGFKGKGYGVVPYDIIAHHESKDFLHVQDISKRDKPILMLHETQFIVIEV